MLTSTQTRPRQTRLLSDPKQAMILIEGCLRTLRSQRVIADPGDGASALTPNTRIDAAGIDSLGLVNVALELERLTGRSLTEQALSGVRTIGDLCGLLSASPGTSQVTRPVSSLDSTFSDYQVDRSPDLFARAHNFRSFLDDFGRRGHDRYLLPVLEQHGARAVVDGGGEFGRREVVRFCTADYLGMAQSEEVTAASARAVEQYGATGASVPLIAGMTGLNRELERQLAEVVATDTCVLYPTGHAANAGAIPTLCDRRDLVVVDKQVHYSILDGVRLAGANWLSFRHNDVEHLDEILARSRREVSDRGILVVVEGVYGIDGDLCPLPRVMEVAHAHGARVMIDDAHSTGVLGMHGGGTAEHYAMDTPPDLVMSSLSKAYGSFGGFIATNADVADYLRYFSKTIAFSVGLPASCIAAAQAAVGVLNKDAGPRQRLHTNIARFRDGLVALGVEGPERSSSAILSLVIGDEPRLRALSRDLFARGVWAEALPFPAVARGDERLRFRVTASHTDADLDQSLAAVESVLREHGMLGQPRGASGSADGIDGGAITDLAATSAARSGRRQPFVSSRLYRKVVAAEPPWATSSPRRMFTSRDRDGLTACLDARREVVSIDGQAREVGLIGHVHTSHGRLDEVNALLERAVEWLGEDVDEIFGPVQHPSFVLGGGVLASTGGPEPFLEPEHDPLLGSVFARAGFRPWRARDYALVDLERWPTVSSSSASSSTVADVTTRSLRRLELRSEMEAITAVINQSIATLDLCAPLAPGQLFGIACEFRELLIEDLWRLAEVDGEVVGFVGAFPNLDSAIRLAGGQASVADIEAIRLEMDTTTTGFISWLGVARQHAASEIGHALLVDVANAMRRRGYQRTILSWEVVDGPRRSRDFLADGLGSEAITRYEILRRS